MPNITADMGIKHATVDRCPNLHMSHRWGTHGPLRYTPYLNGHIGESMYPNQRLSTRGSPTIRCGCVRQYSSSQKKAVILSHRSTAGLNQRSRNENEWIASKSTARSRAFFMYVLFMHSSTYGIQRRVLWYPRVQCEPLCFLPSIIHTVLGEKTYQQTAHRTIEQVP